MLQFDGVALRAELSDDQRLCRHPGIMEIVGREWYSCPECGADVLRRRRRDREEGPEITMGRVVYRLTADEWETLPRESMNEWIARVSDDELRKIPTLRLMARIHEHVEGEAKQYLDEMRGVWLGERLTRERW